MRSTETVALRQIKESKREEAKDKKKRWSYKSQKRKRERETYLHIFNVF